jgi:hypothetical protein
MKERPILFNGDMVRAILEGRKTQTRRIMKVQPEQPASGAYFDAYNGGPQWNWWASDNRQHLDQIVICPYGKPGDRLWVRETWRGVISISPPDQHLELGVAQYTPDQDQCRRLEYRATHKTNGERWRPLTQMPRWASRITLEITGVRVERLQEISESDAWQEGCQDFIGKESPWKGVLAPATVHGFASLWESVYGPGAWESNPWVWVIEFKRKAA